MSTCTDCLHLDLQTIGATNARLGFGKCKAQKLAPATFITSGAARQCERFDPAPADVVAKRVIYIDNENTRGTK